MGKISIGFGVALIALGVGVYTQASSPTALIPAGFGLLIAVFGLLETLKVKAELQHRLTSTFALIGMGGGLFMGIRGWLRLAEGASKLAVGSQLALGGLCLVLLCVRGPMRSWLGFSKLLAFLTKPLRVFVTFMVLTLMYFLMLPFWALFMNRSDPLRKKLDPAAESYFEPCKEREPTLESLSHAS